MMGMNGISSTQTSSLQMLQARQAFTPRPEANPQPDVQQNAPVDEALIASRTGENTTRVANAAPKREADEEARISEVKQMAGELGYVGLSEGAIYRAMVRGESLLADYRA